MNSRGKRNHDALGFKIFFLNKALLLKFNRSIRREMFGFTYFCYKIAEFVGRCPHFSLISPARNKRFTFILRLVHMCEACCDPLISLKITLKCLQPSPGKFLPVSLQIQTANQWICHSDGKSVKLSFRYQISEAVIQMANQRRNLEPFPCFYG